MVTTVETAAFLPVLSAILEAAGSIFFGLQSLNKLVQTNSIFKHHETFIVNCFLGITNHAPKMQFQEIVLGSVSCSKSPNG